MNKENKENIIFFIGLVVLVIVQFVLQYTLQPDEPLNVDSYYYMQYADGILKPEAGLDPGNLLPNILYMSYGLTFLKLFPFFTVIFFYFLSVQLSKSTLKGFIVSLMFSVSPFFFFNNQWGIIDKNSIIMSMFMILIFFWFYVCNDEKTARLHAILFFTFMFFCYLAWEGYALVYFIIFAGILAQIYKLTATPFFFLKTAIPDMTKYIKWIVSVILAITLIFLIPKAIQFSHGLFSPEKGMIAETRFAFELFSPMYLFYVFVFVLLLGVVARESKKDDLAKLIEMFSGSFVKNNLPYIVMYLITLTLFIYMFRFNIFFVVMNYLILAILIKDLDIKDIMLKVMPIFALFLMMSYPMYVREPIADISLKIASEYIRTSPEFASVDCVNTDWGKGHIYQYYTLKRAINRGHPNYEFIKGYFLDHALKTDCVTLISDSEIKILKEVNCRVYGNCDNSTVLWFEPMLDKFDSLHDPGIDNYHVWMEADID